MGKTLATDVSYSGLPTTLSALRLVNSSDKDISYYT